MISMTCLAQCVYSLKCKLAVWESTWPCGFPQALGSQGRGCRCWRERGTSPFGHRGQARCRWASPDGSLRLGKDVALRVYFGGMVREFQVTCDYLGFVGEEAVPPSWGVLQTGAPLPALPALPSLPRQPEPSPAGGATSGVLREK